MQVVIGHIAFKWEMANFDLSYLRHRWPDQHQNLHGWLRRGYDETLPKWCWSHTRGGLHRCATYNKKFPVFFPFLFPLTNAQPKRLERFWWLIAQKTWSGVRRCLLGVRIILSRVLGVKSPKTHNFLALIGNSHYKVAKRQSAITFEPINGNEWNFQDTWPSWS